MRQSPHGGCTKLTPARYHLRRPALHATACAATANLLLPADRRCRRQRRGCNQPAAWPAGGSDPACCACCCSCCCFPCCLLRGTLTRRGLGATAEDAGHAAHEGGLAAACIRQGNTVRSRAFVGVRCRIQQRQLLSLCQGARSVLRSMQAPALAPAHSRGSAALDHLPLSAARPTTTVLPSLAFTTRARLDTAACKHRNKAASRDRGVPAALHRPTPSRHRLCYSCRVCV